MKNKIPFLLGSTLLVWIVLWMFVARLSTDGWWTTQSEWFSTQSVWDEWDLWSFLACPRAGELSKKKKINISNPLTDYTLPVVSFKDGLSSTTYDGWGWAKNWFSIWGNRSAKWNEKTIDDIVVEIDGSTVWCVYSSDEGELVTLYQDLEGACEVAEVEGIVGVRCG